MKKIKYIFLIVVLMIPTIIKSYNGPIDSKYYKLINLDTNQVIIEKDTNEKIQAASINKIMTAIIAIENIEDFNQKIKITYNHFEGIIENNLSTAGFFQGETVTYNDLLYGLMLPSGAEAANALALSISDSTQEFVNLMNQKAKELKMKNTNYVNTIGLDNDNQYTTINDLEILLKYALKNQKFKEIFESSKYTTSDNYLTFKRTLEYYFDKYDLKTSYFKGAKTGYEDKAGLCLASTAEQENTNLMLITTNAPTEPYYPYNVKDAINIYNYYFDNYTNYKVLAKDEVYLKIDTKYAKEKQIYYKAKQDFLYYLPNNTTEEQFDYIFIPSLEITPSISKGTEIGKFKIIYNNQTILEEDIILNKTLNFSLIEYLMINYYIIIIVSIVLFILLIILLLKLKKRCKNENKNTKIRSTSN